MTRQLGFIFEKGGFKLKERHVLHLVVRGSKCINECEDWGKTQAKPIVNLNLNAKSGSQLTVKPLNANRVNIVVRSICTCKVSPGCQMQENSFMQSNMLLHAGLHIEKVRLFCRL